MSVEQKSARACVAPRQCAPIIFTALCLAGCGTTLASRAPADPNIQGAALPCDTWSEPQLQGMLDHQIIPEASGIAISRVFEGRQYHHNDSGGGPYIYVTDAAGGSTQTVTVNGFEPSDVEAMALGPCPAQETRLYLGDIGDNARAREYVRIVIVPEQKLSVIKNTPQQV